MSRYRSSHVISVSWALLVAGLIAATAAADDQPVTSRLAVPDGFRIEVFAEGLKGARFMALGPDSAIYLTIPKAGKVVALYGDGEGPADRIETVVEKLNRPHGIAFHDGALWVAEADAVVKFPGYQGGKAGDPVTVVEDLPGGGNHWTRTIVFGPDDGMLYVSVGSTCNVCIEDDARRAAVTRYRADGSGEERFATGLRNAVGLAWHPGTHELWATHNGRDWLGDDLPPEEIVNIVIQGGDYGWPYCYGDRVPNPDVEMQNPSRCDATIPPVITDTAHSAPLGCAFYTGDEFPEEYHGDLFVAYHGSWNRSEPTGYKVVRVVVEEGKPVEILDFVSGFLPPEGKAIGRPVDVLVDIDGSLVISDDAAGRLFRVRHLGGN
jgi:glucose/arabinose dehydrogenase